MSVWDDMARDAGYRGDEAREVADRLEQEDRPYYGDEPLGTCAIHGDYWTDDCASLPLPASFTAGWFAGHGILDLFSGAGGCAKGYQRAGFHVVGVDNRPQPRYCGDEFAQADALDVLRDLLAGGTVAGHRLEDFDAMHASPPCHAHSTIGKQVRRTGNLGRVDPGSYSPDHPDLVDDTRRLLRRTGLPFVIENVVGAPLENPIMLCGSSFGLDVRRHRLFECNGFAVLAQPCAHHWQTPRFVSLDRRRGKKAVVPVHGGGQLASVVGVHGHLNYAGEQGIRKKAMDIDWMSPYELTQAIPPAMTEHVGHFLMLEVNARASRHAERTA